MTCRVLHDYDLELLRTSVQVQDGAAFCTSTRVLDTTATMPITGITLSHTKEDSDARSLVTRYRPVIPIKVTIKSKASQPASQHSACPSGRQAAAAKS